MHCGENKDTDEVGAALAAEVDAAGCRRDSIGLEYEAGTESDEVMAVAATTLVVFCANRCTSASSCSMRCALASSMASLSR